MPIYEYRCDECRRPVELRMPVGDAPETMPCHREGCTGTHHRRISAPRLRADGAYSYADKGGKG